MRAVTTLSPAFRQYIHLGLDLHRLLLAGEFDSEEAEAVRDASERPWIALSESERERAGWHSEDLNSISDPRPELQPMTPDARRRLTEAVEAQAAGDWDRALTLLRTLKPFVAPEVLNGYRGSIWMALGDPETAAVFLDHAASYTPPARSA